MDGNWQEETINLQEKATLFADQLHVDKPNKAWHWHAFNSMVLKSIKYPMEATL
jgi:hypothetical protein